MWSFKVNRRVVAQVQGSAMKMYPFLFGNCLGSFWFWFFRAVSTFWIANPNNNLIENAAAGAQVKSFNGRAMLCLHFPNILHLLIYVKSNKFLIIHKIWVCVPATFVSVKINYLPTLLHWFLSQLWLEMVCGISYKILIFISS